MVQINERSWAIDLISSINLYVRNKDLAVKAAGGENTLKDSKKSLFPDVLLFTDAGKSSILQGWELKMPDTAIEDLEFYVNAKKKAELLSLNSFLLWNANTAVLYNKEGEDFKPIKY